MSENSLKMTDDELNSKFFEVGYIKDAHSLKGEVFLRLYSGQADWLDDVDAFLLVSKIGIKSEAKITGTRKHKDGLIVKLENINDRNQSEALKGTKIFIPKESLVAEVGESIYLNELLNFEVIDQGQNLIGTVVDFASNNEQDILIVKDKNEQEVLIPLVHDFISQMDMENKKLLMNLPEGLVEVNLKTTL